MRARRVMSGPMTRIPLWLMVIIAVVLAALGGRAISAQDKYTVRPGGLALADCRGYEDWTEVAASHPQGNDRKRT